MQAFLKIFLFFFKSSPTMLWWLVKNGPEVYKLIKLILEAVNGKDNKK